jgi:hypothetical protein
MARAAVDGRMITFIQRLGTSWDDDRLAFSGYLVGMDDYHWLVVPSADLVVRPDEDPNVMLIHKTCPFVMISSAGLSDLPPAQQRRVAKIGQPFWDYCQRAGLARTATTPQEKT